MTRIGIAPKTKSLLVPVYKPVGKTPLECVELYKARHLDDPHITVSYAGRLDPMAEGVLLLLVGDANARRREYEHLEKEYEVTVLVGFSTDTGDLMGKITNKNPFRPPSLQEGDPPSQGKDYMTMLPAFVGAIEQRYPIYSSAKVKGKPLYWWARQGRLDEIEIPTHMVKIDAIELISLGSISHKSLEEYIVKTVGSVQGDFRQEEIVTQWRQMLRTSSRPLHAPHRGVLFFTLRISCGSGTYMRQLVIDMGEKLGIPLCVFRIKRTKVGNYGSEDCEGIH